MSRRPLYLDYHATTPVDERVLSAMQPYFCESFGNPASSAHYYGWEAETAVEQARRTLAQALNATPEEIIFTSGATEANNLAIKGIVEAHLTKGRHLVTVCTEHSAVLEPCRYLERLGFEVSYLPVQPDGLLDLTSLAETLRKDTILVSVMAANNEIGVLQPLTEIGQLCRDRDIIFHTDAAQAFGKIELDVQASAIDLLSLTAHKLYGPKGIGILYCRQGIPLAPQLHGGGQEAGYRSGTLFTPQIVGLGKATELALTELPTEQQRLKNLRDRLWQALNSLDGLMLNGHPSQRLPHNLNFSVNGISPEALLKKIRPHLAISTGSACAGRRAQPSHVLTALGHSAPLARSALRLGLGRFTTSVDIGAASKILRQAIGELR
ncbi:MAG: cysteine desulfurase family protein [Cyanobacteria bacterium P01_H01_bin.15]